MRNLLTTPNGDQQLPGGQESIEKKKPTKKKTAKQKQEEEERKKREKIVQKEMKWYGRTTPKGVNPMNPYNAILDDNCDYVDNEENQRVIERNMGPSGQMDEKLKEIMIQRRKLREEKIQVEKAKADLAAQEERLREMQQSSLGIKEYRTATAKQHLPDFPNTPLSQTSPSPSRTKSAQVQQRDMIQTAPIYESPKSKSRSPPKSSSASRRNKSPNQSVGSRDRNYYDDDRIRKRKEDYMRRQSPSNQYSYPVRDDKYQSDYYDGYGRQSGQRRQVKGKGYQRQAWDDDQYPSQQPQWLNQNSPPQKNESYLPPIFQPGPSNAVVSVKTYNGTSQQQANNNNNKNDKIILPQMNTSSNSPIRPNSSGPVFGVNYVGPEGIPGLYPNEDVMLKFQIELPEFDQLLSEVEKEEIEELKKKRQIEINLNNTGKSSGNSNSVDISLFVAPSLQKAYMDAQDKLRAFWTVLFVPQANRLIFQPYFIDGDVSTLVPISNQQLTVVNADSSSHLHSPTLSAYRVLSNEIRRLMPVIDARTDLASMLVVRRTLQTSFQRKILQAENQLVEFDNYQVQLRQKEEDRKKRNRLIQRELTPSEKQADEALEAEEQYQAEENKLALKRKHVEIKDLYQQIESTTAECRQGLKDWKIKLDWNTSVILFTGRNEDEDLENQDVEFRQTFHKLMQLMLERGSIEF
ncbi:MAG: hypothetical protein EZS28_004693 [Streblomastix strix]|uniref:Uncharacterized protein n=1 Tax=Streblomastix strix TaxID=222440 RepID=A0A5J4WZ38_9EUKA|nr:MAG: hypothetical protein EZS28_004693 [Streblomastix strix]